MKGRFLLYKNDFKIQLGFKIVVKKGTNKIKSSLQTIDFEHDTIKFKMKYMRKLKRSLKTNIFKLMLF